MSATARFGRAHAPILLAHPDDLIYPLLCLTGFPERMNLFARRRNVR